jgi:hypothetical protein
VTTLLSAFSSKLEPTMLTVVPSPPLTGVKELIFKSDCDGGIGSLLSFEHDVINSCEEINATSKAAVENDEQFFFITIALVLLLR